MSNNERPRPDRMYRQGRPAKQNFTSEENLYFRFPPPIDNEEEEIERLDTSVFRFPDMSVNRGKYSEPEDVIFDFPSWGIAVFKVGDIPPSLKSEGGPAYDFKAIHMPEEKNYAHTEVQVFKDGVHIKKSSKIPENVKKTYRTLMMERTDIYKRPT